MLSGRTRILNFDDSVIRQEKLLRRFTPEIVDLTRIGPSCRLWAGKNTLDEIRRRLVPGSRNSITFLGSGDFHHVSSVLADQFDEPVSIIVFDHHPDWDVLPPAYGCGSWVTQVLRRRNVEKVILLGVSSSDISSVWVQTGNLASLEEDRVEIYPYAHKPTLAIFKRAPGRNASCVIERHALYSRIRWRELRGIDKKAFFAQLMKRMGTRRAYISVDKDCLKSDYALTNWEEGSFELEELFGLLRLIKENLDIVGMDIVGDYSLPKTRGILKSLISRLDHPKDYSARGKAPERVDSVNEGTNLKILELLIS